MNWKFENLFDGKTWKRDVFVSTNEQGLIESFSPESSQSADQFVPGFAVPGFQNGHSHAFQYAMSGMAENRSLENSEDDFWSWRTQMYKVALRIGPDELERVAYQLYSEMLRLGYTHVTEFHYLHHDPSGNRYNDLAELGGRLLRAADMSGIGITLVPILYQRGGFKMEAKPEQRRFISTSFDDYLQLLVATRKHLRPGQKVAAGIHSLRAVPAETLKEFDAFSDIPIHIHISEQTGEVEECLSVNGARPVQWLSKHVDLSENWNLVHATHIDANEMDIILQAQANVVLCPSTEGSLGDGVFPLTEYHRRGGLWSIGSDSHVSLSPLEELRWVDYTQRKSLRKRNTLCSEPGEESGETIIKRVQKGSAVASGRSPMLKVGESLDAIVVRKDVGRWQALPAEKRLSTLIYSTDPGQFLMTIAAGKIRSQALGQWPTSSDQGKERAENVLPPSDLQFDL